MPLLRVDSARLPLRTPLRTTWGELHQRDVLTVRLTWDGNDHGLGEAAPLEHHDGVSLAAVRAALDVHREVLRRMPVGASHAELLAACAAERFLPHALAAIDCALWDRAGRRAGKPVAELLDGNAPRAVPVHATIGARDPVFAAAEAYRAAMAGYRCVKVRVGIGDDDEARVMAVRQAVGPRVAIRIDAGGAWPDAHEALSALHALTAAGIELAEEPLPDDAELAELRRESPIPIAVDALDPDSPQDGFPEFLRLRVASCGGISELLRRAREARRVGVQVYVASSFDGPLGTAAGVHAAAALLAHAPLPACGLATLGMFHEHAHMLPIDNGSIQVPSEPGLLGTTTRVK